jgi:hypothetical protein
VLIEPQLHLGPRVLGTAGATVGSMKGVLRSIGPWAAVVLQDEGSGSRDCDGDYIHAAHDAVPFKVLLAEARGEKEGPEDGCEDSGDDVWDEEDDVLDELGAVGAGLIEKRKVGEDEDGDSGESEGSPKQGLGYVPRGPGTRESGGHLCSVLEICLDLRRLFGSLVSSVVTPFQMNTHAALSSALKRCHEIVWSFTWIIAIITHRASPSHSDSCSGRCRGQDLRAGLSYALIWLKLIKPIDIGTVSRMTTLTFIFSHTPLNSAQGYESHVIALPGSARECVDRRHN